MHIFREIKSIYLKVINLIMNDKTKIFLKKIKFGIFNYLFFPNRNQFNVLFWLSEQNKSAGDLWFLIAFLLNIIPFLLAVIIEAISNNSNVIYILNNGSIPVLAFSIISTNLVYLIENLPAEREIFAHIKTRLQIFSIIVIAISIVVYIFQSNFVKNFSEDILMISFYSSALLLGLSVILGKKMFLLQNKLIAKFEDNFKDQLEKLNQIPPANDITF